MTDKLEPSNVIRIDPLQSVTKRISVLRVCFVLSLLAAGAACAYISYSVIDHLEDSVATNTYQSVVSSAIQNAKEITKRKVDGARLISSVFKHACPEATMWPFCSVDGYRETAGMIASQSSTLTQALLVILRENQVEEFESFAFDTYRKQGYVESAGVYDFGFGIFGRHANGTRYHKTKLGVSWSGSKNDIIVPIFLHNNENAKSILFDVYSSEVQGRLIDAQLECTQRAESNGTLPRCITISDFKELILRPGPAAVLYQPVYPANDPFNQVGVAGTSFYWDEVLFHVVPDYIQGQIVAVISTSTASYSFSIRAGIATLMGPSDMHDRRYTSLGEGSVMTDFIESDAGSEIYTLTFYPSAELFAEFRSYSPLAIALGFAGVMVFSTLVFFLYDYFVKHESHQRKAILEVKRRFVRFVSHEIRTPLNTVCMGLELLREDLQRRRDAQGVPGGITQNTGKLKEWIDLTNDIAQNSSDAVLVLNDLLNYDKIESGSLRLGMEEEDPYSLTSSIVSQLKIEAIHRRVDLRFIFQNKLVDPHADIENPTSELHVCLLADSGRLGQVIRNVLSNALKFTPEGGIVRVTLFYVSDCFEGSGRMNTNSAKDHTRIGTACIQVQDSGVGMTTEQLRQLYGEGVQFDANKLQAGGGSGLGLWVSKGIVESHGGSICADSEGIDRGCTFTVRLPLYQSNHTLHSCNKTALTIMENSPCHNDSEMESSLRQEEQIVDANPANFHILVAEDSVPNRKMLVRLLERQGHTCETATDGREAVNLVQERLIEGASQRPFDLILMDFEMPRLNGPEATKEIRDLGFSGTVLGVTGNVLKEDVDYFKQHGANDVLAKPVRYPVIESALASVSKANTTDSSTTSFSE